MDENPFPQIIFICKTDARDRAILRLLESRVSDKLVFVLFGWNTIEATSCALYQRLPAAVLGLDNERTRKLSLEKQK